MINHFYINIESFVRIRYRLHQDSAWKIYLLKILNTLNQKQSCFLKHGPVVALLNEYPIASVEQQLRKEIARLVDIGVLEEDYSSEWASPTFAIPKNNGTIRVVSDFRKFNSLLKRHPFPIPEIGDMVRSME